MKGPGQGVQSKNSELRLFNNNYNLPSLFPTPYNPAKVNPPSSLSRTIVHLADRDRNALHFIRESLELTSSALAIRLAVRSLAEEIETKNLIQKLVAEWEEREGVQWENLV